MKTFLTKLKIWIAYLMLITALTGCGSGTNGSKGSSYYVTVTVQVVDEVTGQAVQGAVTIIENGPVGSQDGSGKTVFKNILGNKSYTFVTTANSYNINRKTVEIGSSNQTITITLNQLKGTIQGVIIDEVEKPIEASVKLDQLSRTVNTDPSTGEFLFDDVPVMDDKYSITITKPGYDDRIFENIKLTAQNINANVGRIMLGNTPGTLNGRVTDTNTRIITGAEVRVLETNQSVTTDSNGDYSISVLPGSNYTAEYSHPDYGTVTKTGIVIRPGQINTISVSLPIKPGSIFGIVRNGLDAPIPGATVTVVGAGLNAITALDGSFRVSNVPPGTYTLSVTHDLYNSTSASAVVKTNEETNVGIIVMPSLTGTVKGYISNSNCTVILVEANQAQSYINPGSFQFLNIPAGNHMLKIERTPYKSVYIPFTLESGSTKDLGNLSCNSYQVGAPFGEETKTVNVGESNSEVVNITQTRTFSYSFQQKSQSCSFRFAIYENNNFLEDRSGFASSSNSVSVTLKSGSVYRVNPSYSGGTGSYSLSFINDIKTPQINLSRTWGVDETQYSININAIDTNLTSVQYCFTNSQTKPSSGYKNGTTATINQKGTWYLHVRALDKADHEGYRCEGPFIIK